MPVDPCMGNLSVIKEHSRLHLAISSGAMCSAPCIACKPPSSGPAVAPGPTRRCNMKFLGFAKPLLRTSKHEVHGCSHCSLFAHNQGCNRGDGMVHDPNSVTRGSKPRSNASPTLHAPSPPAVADAGQPCSFPFFSGSVFHMHGFLPRGWSAGVAASNIGCRGGRSAADVPGKR
ncbi:hypothetical protein B0I35DRAFT_422406 [Stachybotrys elegans]|uniref:Uncharacterized protein n=1 Tax=Stachybotrys elegans TaxID=80388 RepID=A0A8K0SZU1_9HYPO|nr:hypothetical protein B0I35DRAFT_422406 [Stachybotrys elegans]